MASRAGLVVAAVIAAALITFPLWGQLLAPSTTTTHVGGGYGGEHGEHGYTGAATETTTCITGRLQRVDVGNKVVYVNGVEIYVHGRWIVNGESYNPYDMLGLLEKHVGDKITICYYISSEGWKMASKIVIDGIKAERG